MVKHLCLENYQAAANAALKFPPLRRELVKAVTSAVRTEVTSYSRGKTTAKYDGDPLNLKHFKTEDFLQEARERIPVTHAIVTATSKVGAKYLQNKQALALSAILNTWLPRSNFIYRNNTLLTAGCCKSEVMDLFHRLGLSSHPDTIRAQLQSAADHFDKEILAWKTQIEVNRKQLKLIEEINNSQTRSSEDVDSMDLCSIDFSRETAQKCKHFDEKTFQSCQELLPDISENLKKERLPLYRLVNLTIRARFLKLEKRLMYRVSVSSYCNAVLC